ncbi:MAG: hypothetical protein Q8N35_08995 [Methylococcaceae bacterium]|nr:hypothetical protein [Methylococcaceae bacterium]MDZ4156108.1 hypothetical protein [Methylococcales bacterium]MDP2393687.1 hypothetical protein [Methylococcaceae bacterium]MDP3019713.1 hypothetical protein [Methylococcaceae bacterium]MDP3390181.1 hypothetical protein [Methylococcaceae bacterium]
MQFSQSKAKQSKAKYFSRKIITSLTVAVAISSVISQSAYATIVASGNAYIPSVNNNQGTVNVGVGSLNGTLEVNASPLGNGFTSFTASGLTLGGYGGTGTVKVIGNGTSGTAQININTLWGLRNYTGLLEIKNGGVINSSGNVYLGNQWLNEAPGFDTTTIDGNGSVLRAQQASTGANRDGGRISIGFDGQSTSTVNITNGGLLEALSGHVGDVDDDGSIYIGEGGAGYSGSVAGQRFRP